MQCQHTHRCGPYKFALRLLLYHGCTPYTEHTHTTHTRIHHDHTCMAVVHTRVVVVSVVVSSSGKQSKKNKKLKCGVRTHRLARTYIRAHASSHTQNRHRYNISQLMLEEPWSMGCCTRRIVTVGAAAADPHSCWWRWRCYCCCVPARLGVEPKKLGVANYFTAADGAKNKKL